MMERDIICNILKQDREGEEYIIFNHQNKSWIVPRKFPQPGLDMYQPTGIVGKTIKKIVSKLIQHNIETKLLNLHSYKATISKEIENILNTLYQCEKYFLAFYIGDPSSVQNEKITIMIYNESKILSYIKYTNNQEVIKNFQKETMAIDFLKSKGFYAVPDILLFENKEAGCFYAQNTKKKINYTPLQKKDDAVFDTISALNDITKSYCFFEQSDFYHYIKFLKKCKLQFADKEKQTIMKSIHLVEEHYLIKQKYWFSFFHGDFTPWNIYYNGDVLELFDLEYCQYTMPPFIDIYHYFTQYMILIKHYSAGRIVKEFLKIRNKLAQYVESPEFTYICYLLSIISFYEYRTKPEFQCRNYTIWIKLLHIYNEMIE